MAFISKIVGIEDLYSIERATCSLCQSALSELPDSPAMRKLSDNSQRDIDSHMHVIRQVNWSKVETDVRRNVPQASTLYTDKNYSLHGAEERICHWQKSGLERSQVESGLWSHSRFAALPLLVEEVLYQLAGNGDN